MSAFPDDGRTFGRQAAQAGEGPAVDAALSTPLDLLRVVADKMDQPIVATDRDGRVIYLNERYAALFGHTLEEARGQPLAALLPQAGDAMPALKRMIEGVRETGHFKGDLFLFSRDHMPLWVQVVANAVHDEAGAFSHVVGAVSDITFAKLREALQHGIFSDMLNDRPLAETMENLCHAVQSRLDGFSMSVVRLVDHQRIGVLAGPDLPDWYHALIDGIQVGPEAGSCGTAMWRGQQVMVRDIHSHPLWSPWRAAIQDLPFRSCWSTPILRSDGGVLGAFALYSREDAVPNAFHRQVIGICANLCTLAFERHEAQERLHYMARHDPLTGLHNRAHFMALLEAQVAAAKADGRGVALHLLRFAGFKDVTGFTDPAAGDRLLVDFARSLSAQFPRHGIARFGDAEFAVIQPLGAAGDEAEGCARKLMDLAAQAQRANMVDPQIMAIMGYALFPADAQGARDLFQRASMALHQPRQPGGSGVNRFAPDYAREIGRRRHLERDLRRTLNEGIGHLWVAYQPQYRIDDGALVGFEALARWDHPQIGAIAPATFIPIAEEANLIGALSWHVLREACRTATGWPAHVSLAANVSGLSLAERDFHQNICAILLETGLSPGRLELEITESVLIRDRIHALHALRQLKAMAIRIAMDDFGTGYSSLAYLHDFPFDKIKIDRSFVTALGRKANGGAIVRTIVGLGQALGIPVLAEGVESRDQLDMLRSEGCALAQGYYLGAPMDDAQASALACAAPPQEAARTDAPVRRGISG